MKLSNPMAHVFHNSDKPIAGFRTMEQARAFIARMVGKGFGGMTAEMVQSPAKNEWIANGYR